MANTDCQTSIASPEPPEDRAGCPVCRSSHLVDFFHLPQLPVHVGVLYRTADEAKSAPHGTLTLSYCCGCGLVHNRRFEPAKLVFEPGYEVQLVHSLLFRQFLESLAQRLVERYELHGKDVVDIGCGAGHFLKLLCAAGGNRGLGIDPTLRQSQTIPLASGELHLVRDHFGPSYATRACDFATCQSVLEDIPDPVTFIGWIRQMLVPRGGTAYLEVFNAWRAFEAGETWSLCYEQCNYYSREAFAETVRRAGFQVLQAAGCYGEDQYVYVEAQPAEPQASPDEPPPRQAVPEVITRFGSLHARKVDEWRWRVEHYRATGQRVAVWGSGGKGICFLNTVGAADVFQVVVDINPDRQGHYLPGTAQPVVAPAWLQANPVDVIVLTNPLYEREIRAAAGEMGLNSQFVVT